MIVDNFICRACNGVKDRKAPVWWQNVCMDCLLDYKYYSEEMSLEEFINFRAKYDCIKIWSE